MAASERGSVTVHPFHRRLALLAVVGVAVTGLVASCSLPVDERATRLDPGAIPDDLTEPTTTTTTSTTMPPTTTIPEDTSVDSPETTTTTTQPGIPTQTQAVRVFYTRGLSDVMQPVEVPRPVLTPVEELVPLLERPGDIGDLRTALLPGLIADISPVERATVTVSLDPVILDRMSEPNRQRAVAQIVLTLTSFVTTDAGAIGFVRFEVDGEGFSVFVPGFGGQSEEGEPLAHDDFSTLIVTSPTPTSTTPTTTTPTGPPPTSVPPGSDGGE